jgi:hypothetical protein
MANDRSDPGSGAPTRYPGSFFLAFREAALGLGLTAVKWLGDGVVIRDKERQESTVGLDNVFRRCKQHDRTEWVNIIRDFLEHVGPSHDEKEAPEDLNAVAERILPRLGQPVSSEEIIEQMWWDRLDPERLWLNLVIDFPTRMMYVSKELIEKSGRPDEFWRDKALENLRARTPAGAAGRLNEDSEIRLVCCEDSYDAARALILDTLLPESADKGCFVAPVSRDQLWVLPVTVESLSQVHILKLLARDNFEKMPYPISDEVYWVRGGKWEHFEVDIQDKNVTVRPPQAFVEMFEEFEGGDEAGEEGEAPPDAEDSASD